MSSSVLLPRARLFGLLCCAVALVGCSAANAVGTTRTDSTRTTVPADANAQVNTGGFGSAALRTVDPCGLLDAKTMSQFGTVSQSSGLSQLDSCQLDINDIKGHDLNVRVTIGDDLSDNKPTGTIAGLPVAEHASASICFERLITQQHPTTGIEVEVNYDNSADSCVVARQVAGLVVGRIRNKAPQRAGGVGSLALVNPCDTIDDASAASITQGQPDKTAEGFYKCDWQSQDYDLSVEFKVDTNPKDDTFDGTPQQVDVGVPAYAFSSTDVFPSCDVKWEVRPLGAGSNNGANQGEVVDVQFGNVLGGNVDPCAQAETAAKLVAAKVPHAS
ncbi:MAG TPA: DUF3558 family protein [Pseudonocardiaceae bacterium]|nr:DUF3558 family protein [Pseudonocardiaceae bacterium]